MPYRILSLDGGGVWSLIQVRTLISLYGADTQGHAVLKAFDLIAANAGGSLVLAGLVENMKLADLLALFMDERKRHALFPPTKQTGGAVLRLLPKSGRQGMQQAANGIIGQGGRPVHLLVIGFDDDRNRVRFFRSQPAGATEWNDGMSTDMPLAAVVHISMRASIDRFPVPAESPLSLGRFWNGSITGCDNPLLAAVVEAITLNVSPGNIRALSLGTAMVSRAPATPGAGGLDDAPDAATSIAHAVTGGADGLAGPVVSRVVRFNPLINPATQAGRRVCGLDTDVLTSDDVAVLDTWCRLWLGDQVPNQPIGMDAATPALGYGCYSEALLAWQSLFPWASHGMPAALVAA